MNERKDYSDINEKILEAIRLSSQDVARGYILFDEYLPYKSYSSVPFSRTGKVLPSIRTQPHLNEWMPHIRHEYGVSYRLPSYAWPSIVEDIPISRDYLAVKAFMYAMAILGGVSLGTMLLMELVR